MKILFAADMSFNYFPSYPGKEKAYAAMQQLAAEFRSADFSMLNLENIMGRAEDYSPIVKTGPNLISEDGFLDYVDALAPTAIGLANNHAGDYGDGALLRTIKMLDEKGYLVCGAGENVQAAYRPVVFEKDGISVAVIAVCENEFGLSDTDRAGCAGYSIGRVTAAIREARAEGRLPIVYFHGGNEYYPFPSPGKKELYRHFVDLGAAAVVAMHTHCPQGYETYNGAPIVYSMGNLFFPSLVLQRSASWNHGYMTLLDVTKSGVSVARVIPYSFNFDKITILSGAEKDAFIDYLTAISSVIADDEKLGRYFDAWCVMEGLGAYIAHLGYDKSMEAGGEDGAKAVKKVRNLFYCEAHNELIRRTLGLLYEGRLDEAKSLIPNITELQDLRIPQDM